MVIKDLRSPLEARYLFFLLKRFMLRLHAAQMTTKIRNEVFVVLLRRKRRKKSELVKSTNFTIKQFLCLCQIWVNLRSEREGEEK